MSNLVKKMVAKVVPFAHLLGARSEAETDEDNEQKKKDEASRAKWAEKAETDDERKQKEGESEDEYAKRMEEMDEEEEKGKKAKGEKADSDSDSDDETSADEVSEEAKAARQIERARCAKIIAHGIRNGCVNQAGVFAFDTTMSVKQAIDALLASKLDGGAKSPGLGQRMAAVHAPRVGSDVPASHDSSDQRANAKVLADRIIASAAKARGEKA